MPCGSAIEQTRATTAKVEASLANRRRRRSPHSELQRPKFRHKGKTKTAKKASARKVATKQAAASVGKAASKRSESNR